MKEQQVFHKELYEEIRTKTKAINRLKLRDDRINAIAELRDSIYDRINDEVDDLLAEVNLKKNKNENED